MPGDKELVAQIPVTEVTSEAELSGRIRDQLIQAESMRIYKFRFIDTGLEVLIGVTLDKDKVNVVYHADVIYHDPKYGRPLIGNIKRAVRETLSGIEMTEEDVGLVRRSATLYNYSSNHISMPMDEAVEKMTGKMDANMNRNKRPDNSVQPK